MSPDQDLDAMFNSLLAEVNATSVDKPKKPKQVTAYNFDYSWRAHELVLLVSVCRCKACGAVEYSPQGYFLDSRSKSGSETRSMVRKTHKDIRDSIMLFNLPRAIEEREMETEACFLCAEEFFTLPPHYPRNHYGQAQIDRSSDRIEDQSTD